MKLKKLLSFALALAMVLAFVPTLSLTASADSTTVYATTTFSYNVSNSAMETYPSYMNQKGGTARDGYAVFAIPEDMQNADSIDIAITVTMKTQIGGFNAHTSNVYYLLLDEDLSEVITEATSALAYISGTQTYTSASTIYVDSAAGASDTSGTFSVVPNGAKSIIVMIEHYTGSGNAGGVFYNATEDNAPYLTLTPKFAADVAITYKNASGDVLGTSTDTAYVGDSYQPVKEDTAPDGYSLITFDEDVDGVYGYIAEVISGNDAETIERTSVERTVVIAPVYKLVSDNMVTNGGFETGDFTGWTQKGGTSEVSTTYFSLTSDTDNVSEGTYALSTVNSSNGDNECSVMNTVKTTEEGIYYVAVDVKGYSGTSQYMWMSAGGSVLGSNYMSMSTSAYTTVSYITDSLASGSTISIEGNWFQDAHPYIDNFAVYQIEAAASETSVTVEYVDSTSGETIDREEVTGLFSGSTYTPSVSGTYYDYVGDDGTGYLYTYGTIETITLATSGNVAQVPLIRYKKITASLVENGDFSDGFDGWSTDEINQSYFSVNSDGALAYGGTAYSSRTLNGIGGTASFQKNIAVESGKEYYYSIDVYQSGIGNFMSYAFTDGTALATQSESSQVINGKAYIFDGCESDIYYDNTSTLELTGSSKFASGYIGSWNTFADFVTATNQTKAFEFDIYYFCDSTAGQVDNVKFYELAPLDQIAITFDKQISGTSVGTETKYYNDDDEYSESFAERVNADGDVSRTGNYLYTGASTGTATADATVVVDLTQVANADVNGLTEGGVYDDNGTLYLIRSGNLIPNGDMALGKTGYTTGVNADVSISDGFDLVEDADGNYITANGSTGVYQASSILGGYDVEDGKTYLLTVDVMNGYGATHNGDNNWMQYGTYNTSYPHRGSLSNGLTINDNVSDKFETSYNIITSDSAVMELSFRWIENVSLKNFGLYEIEATDLGVTVIDGAQIRIGGGVDGEELADMTNSGLRFIATVDTDNTIAAEALDENADEKAEIGIAISADDTFDADKDLLVAAETYQDDAGSVFTVAITNIKEANYNTVYYAFAYVTLDGVNYYTSDTPVARTPYQVAAGILTTEGTDSDGYDQSTDDDDILYAVLNVYANKTGARLTIIKDASAESGYTVLADIESNDNATGGAYANGAVAFFNIDSCTVDSDGNCTIVISGSGAAKFYSYAIDQYRINNAHKALADNEAKAVINEDGTMTITIPASLLG